MLPLERLQLACVTVAGTAAAVVALTKAGLLVDILPLDWESAAEPLRAGAVAAGLAGARAWLDGELELEDVDVDVDVEEVPEVDVVVRLAAACGRLRAASSEPICRVVPLSLVLLVVVVALLVFAAAVLPAAADVLPCVPPQ